MRDLSNFFLAAHLKAKFLNCKNIFSECESKAFSENSNKQNIEKNFCSIFVLQKYKIEPHNKYVQKSLKHKNMQKKTAVKNSLTSKPLPTNS